MSTQKKNQALESSNLPASSAAHAPTVVATRTGVQAPRAVALKKAADAWRSEPSALHRDALALAMRDQALRAVRGRLKVAADADDVANEVVLRCLAAMDRGAIAVGGEAGYVFRAAGNAANSEHRRQAGDRSGVFRCDTLEDAEDQALHSLRTPVPSAELRLMQHEHAREVAEQEAHLEAVLRGAPEEIRRTLRLVASLTPAERWEAELAESRERGELVGDDPLELKRARNRSDQRASRSVQWIKGECARTWKKKDGAL